MGRSTRLGTVFYNLNGGGLACAGYVQWTGSQVSILAYGTQLGQNNGFAAGETFQWKIWKNSTTEEFDADVTYIIGMPNLGNFDAYGYSGLTSLVAISSLQMNFVLNHISCYGDSNGLIDITVSGGLLPYTFIWSNGHLTEDITNITSGNYFITISDATSQILIDSFEISQPASEILFSLTKTDITIENAADGSIDLTVSGGVPPYLYLWSNNEITEDLSGLSAGTYTVTVSDSNLCSKSAYIEIFSIQGQSLVLELGWNLISTYIDPVYPLVDSAFNPVISSLLIMKDYNGNPYWPQFNLNMIGDLTIGHGYQVKMSMADTLTIIGTIVTPENNPISLPTTWSIIGYLRKNAAPLDSMLYSIYPNIIIVKDNNGSVYWPQFGFNLIGDIEPGQGYQLNLLTSDTLTYLPNDIIPPYTCGNTITDYDSNSYNTVLIGSQCWMAENLATTHYPNGSAIQKLASNSTWGALLDNNIDDAYCYYDNSTSNFNLYGALYSWAAAMGDNAVSSSANPSGVQGVCPIGWHLPSDDEWKQLEIQLGMSQSVVDDTGFRGTNQGSKLAGNFSLWNSGVLENNSHFGTSGFAAWPGGYRLYFNGSYSNLGNYGIWWSSTENGGSNAWTRGLICDDSGVRRNDGHKSNGFSVRCLKNN